MFRLELWIHPDYKTEENLKNYPLSTLKDFLFETFGSMVEDKPISIK